MSMNRSRYNVRVAPCIGSSSNNNNQNNFSNKNTNKIHDYKKNRNYGPKQHHPSDDSSTSSSSSSSSSSSTFSTSPESSPTNFNDQRRRRGRCRPPSKKEQQKQDALFPPKSDYVALDCEMVGIGADGHVSAVARVTLVDWHGQVLLDQFVRPNDPITDYRTFVSGITSTHLITACTLEDVRPRVQELLQDKILVGHALKNDLKALDIHHPWYLTRDTAKYEPFMQVRFDDGILWPRKLKDLVQEKMGREIQVSGQPHSSIEDATAALDLYRSVRAKWESVVTYKMQKTQQILRQQQEKQLQQESQHQQQEQSLVLQ